MLAGYGMTPMAGRLWAWLLICDPPAQTAAEIAAALRRAGARSVERPGSSPTPASSGGPPDAATAASISRHRQRRSTRSCPAPAGLSADPRDGRARARRHRGPAPRVARSPPGDARRDGLHRTRGPRGDGPLSPAASRRTGRKERDRMTSVIRTEKLTKSYGSHRGIIEVDLEVAAGRGLRLPRAQRRRQDDDDPDDARPDPPDQSAGRSCSASSRRADPVAIHRRIGYIPGEFALYDRLTGKPDARVLRQPPRRRRPGLPGVAHRALRPRPGRRFKEYSKGNKQKVGRDRRAPAPARAAGPRRAHVGPRPARPADVLRDPPRGGGRRRDRLPLVPHPVRGREDAATAWRSSATGGWSRSTRSRACATSPTTRWSSGSPAPCPTAAFERLPGVSDLVADDHVLRMRVAGPITPVVRAAAQYELLDFVSPRAEPRGDVPGAVRPRGRRGERPWPLAPARRAMPRRPSHRSRSVAGSTASAASTARRSATRGSRSSSPPACSAGMALRHGRRRRQRLPDARSAPGGRQARRQHARPSMVNLFGNAGHGARARWAATSPGSTAPSSPWARRCGRSSPSPATLAGEAAPRQPRLRRRRAVRQAPDRAREAGRAT